MDELKMNNLNNNKRNGKGNQRKFSFWVLEHSKSDKPENLTTQAHKH